MIGSTILSRAILSLELRDELASKSRMLTSHLKFDSIIFHLLKPYDDAPTCLGVVKKLELCPIMDFIGHLIRFGRRDEKLLEQICREDSVFETTLNIAKVCKESFRANKNKSYYSIIGGLMFGATYVLSQYCSFFCNDVNTSSKKQSKLKMIAGQFIRRFELDSENENNGGDQKPAYITPINFAINQASSRDLIRRVLMFHSGFSSIYLEGGRSMDSEIFAATCSKASMISQSSVQHSLFEERMEKLNEQFEMMRRDRDALSQELTNKDSYFQQQLHYVKQQSRSEAIEKAEVIAEERNILELKLMSAKNELSAALNEIKEYKMESVKRENELKKQVDEVKGENLSLEEKLMELEQILERKNEDAAAKDRKITQLNIALSDIEERLDNEKNEKQLQKQDHIALEQEHTSVKEKLEDALSKLISLAKSYVAQEKMNEEEVSQLRETIDEANNKENEVKRKYQHLKEMYHGAQEKIKALNHKVEKMKASYSQQTSKSTRSQVDSKSSSRHRQPMGTLAFMNSIHDTSMRRMSGKERNQTDRKKSSDKTSRTSSRSIKKSSSHRNMR